MNIFKKTIIAILIAVFCTGALARPVETVYVTNAPRTETVYVSQPTKAVMYTESYAPPPPERTVLGAIVEVLLFPLYLIGPGHGGGGHHGGHHGGGHGRR